MLHTIQYISTVRYGRIAMATVGTTIEIPRIGQRITFTRTAADTEGHELRLEAVMRPGAFIPPHVHIQQEESFEVLAGVGTFRVAGRKIVAGPGEQVVIPAGVAHRFRNRSSTDVRVSATLRPALRVEDLFERLFRLGAGGLVNRLGAPRPLATAALIREFRDEFFYLPWIPVAFQRMLAGAKP
jgi:mannose-6-phosphate isomerase-like protein (cupin superfamily)